MTDETWWECTHAYAYKRDKTESNTRFHYNTRKKNFPNEKNSGFFSYKPSRARGGRRRKDTPCKAGKLRLARATHKLTLAWESEMMQQQCCLLVLSLLLVLQKKHNSVVQLLRPPNPFDRTKCSVCIPLTPFHWPAAVDANQGNTHKTHTDVNGTRVSRTNTTGEGALAPWCTPRPSGP